MLFRKIASYVEDFLSLDNDKILILDGARQVGKSFSMMWASSLPNFMEPISLPS